MAFALVAHNGLLEASSSSKQSKNRSRSQMGGGRARECVSRGKCRTAADQPADVEISDQTNPVQSSPRPGQNPLTAAKAQSRERSRDERDSRRDG